MTDIQEASKRAQLQIQPVYACREEWEAIARQEGFTFEALELSAPPYLGGRHPGEEETARTNNVGGSWDQACADPWDQACADFIRSVQPSAERAECREWYRTGGLVTSLHGAFIDVNPASGDPLFRLLSQRRCRESCSLAYLLGAGHVVFHSSCAAFLRGTYLDSWAGRCAEFYEELAERSRLRIWIENSQDMDPEPLRELMRRIRHPRIGVCLDLGHAHYSRVPISGWLEALGNRIGYLHLSDNHGIWDEHLPLGEGSVDWEEADAFWRSSGRDMPMTLEVGGPEGVRRSVSFLKERGYFGIG